MAYFTAAADAAELIALAWVLEEGSRKFYAALAEQLSGKDGADLFRDLVGAEERHKSSLRELYRTVSGQEPGPDFPRPLAIAREADGWMEGNVSVAEALAWAKGRQVRDLLELSMALETNSYDLYIKMSRAVPGAQAINVFERLSEEEKQHLKRMAELLDRSLAESAPN